MSFKRKFRSLLTLALGFLTRPPRCRGGEIVCTSPETGTSADTPAIAECTPSLPVECPQEFDQVSIPGSVIAGGVLSHLSATAILCYIQLCSHADTGRPTPPISYDDLSRATGRSRRMVIYSVDELIANGLIERSAAGYRVLLAPKPAGELPPSHYRARSRASDCTDGDVTITDAIDCVLRQQSTHVAAGAVVSHNNGGPGQILSYDQTFCNGNPLEETTLAQLRGSGVPPQAMPEHDIELSTGLPSVHAPGSYAGRDGRSTTSLIECLLRRAVPSDIVAQIEIAAGTAKSANWVCRSLLGRGQFFSDEQELRSVVQVEALKLGGS